MTQNRPSQPSLPPQSPASEKSHAKKRSRKMKIFWRNVGAVIALAASLATILQFAGVVNVESLFQHPTATPTHTTTTTQTCPRGMATPFIASSSYDMAVAKSGIQFGFDAQHSRTNPYESILNPDNVGNLQQKWDYLIGKDIDTSPPAVANGMVYVGANNGKLYAFDAATGHEQWCASTGGAINSSPAVAKGLVYVGSQDGNLYAFDAVTGQEKGVGNVGNSTSSSPTIANGLIYIGSDNGKLYVFNTPIAGQSNWVPKWVAATNPSSPTGQKGIASSPAVANNLVYIGSFTNHSLYAFNATGCGRPVCSPLWTEATGDAIYSSPTVANCLVYVGSIDGRLYAFDATAGQQKGEVPASSDPKNQGIDSSPAVADGVVYIGSQDGRLYAFSLP